MGDFATTADIVSAVNGVGHIGGRRFFNKNTITTVAALYYSGWTCGGIPAAGATPGAAATCTQATTGALATFNPALSGGTLRLLEWNFGQTTSNSNTMLYDRLAHMGGLSGTVTTAQTVNVNLTTPSADGRCSSVGADCEWFLEWFAATGATAVNATVSYTNEAGTAGRTVVIALPASVPIGRMYSILPATPDLAIKSVETVTLSASTLTAGSFGVVVGKRLAMVPFFTTQFGGKNANAGMYQLPTNDAFVLGLPKIGNNTCLWEVAIAYSTSFCGRVGYFIIGGRP